MRTQQTFLAPLNESTWKRITEVVKETLDPAYRKTKMLSAAELWNIQRQHRTITQRRRFV